MWHGGQASTVIPGALNQVPVRASTGSPWKMKSASPWSCSREREDEDLQVVGRADLWPGQTQHRHQHLAPPTFRRRKLYPGPKTLWILLISTLPLDSGSLIFKHNATFTCNKAPLSNSSVLSVLSPGERHFSCSHLSTQRVDKALWEQAASSAVTFCVLCLLALGLRDRLRDDCPFSPFLHDCAAQWTRLRPFKGSGTVCRGWVNKLISVWHLTVSYSSNFQWLLYNPVSSCKPGLQKPLVTPLPEKQPVSVRFSAHYKTSTCEFNQSNPFFNPCFNPCPACAAFDLQRPVTETGACHWIKVWFRS